MFCMILGLRMWGTDRRSLFFSSHQRKIQFESNPQKFSYLTQHGTSLLAKKNQAQIWKKMRRISNCNFDQVLVLSISSLTLTGRENHNISCRNRGWRTKKKVLHSLWKNSLNVFYLFLFRQTEILVVREEGWRDSCGATWLITGEVFRGRRLPPSESRVPPQHRRLNPPVRSLSGAQPPQPPPSGGHDNF